MIFNGNMMTLDQMQIAEDEEYVCRLTLQGHIDFHFAACI
jgi:hypothetical protein